MLQEKLAHTEERLQYGADLVLAHVDLLAYPIELYNRVPGHVRRDLLGAMFTQLIVHVEDDGIAVDRERTEVNAALHHWNAQRHLSQEGYRPERVDGFLI